LIEETNPRKRQSLETINSQAFRAYDMLANLMHYAAAPPAKFECIDPVAVTRRALVEFASYFPAFPANMLNSRFPDQPLTVEADPLQLAALLHALLRNAHEATGGEGRISLQLSLTTGAAEQSPQIEWTLSDDGPPIDPIAVRFFCDPFHSGREAGRGLGFGLSRALRIVEAHGGHLELIPGVDRGLIARAALPVSVRQHTLRQSE
jgi:signal transduction histidine kinase